MRTCSVNGCFNKHYGKGFCQKHYVNYKKYGYPIKHFYTRPLDFEINEDGCFVCTSHDPDNEWYPQYRIRGKKWRMHRFVYTEMFGEIPDGLVVRHKCDNPRCINPEHLELGTIADNNRDAVERNRKRSIYGSKHHATKLNESKVADIKRLLKSEMYTSRKIAQMYGVSDTVISMIKNNKYWKHVKI